MGTGLAPWRAVTQERICQHRQGQKVGPCMLFFGARYAIEYLYKDEFESYVKEGVLSMHTAFSREQARKIYVSSTDHLSSLRQHGGVLRCVESDSFCDLQLRCSIGSWRLGRRLQSICCARMATSTSAAALARCLRTLGRAEAV